MKLWKVLGLAGLAGVAATGVIIARDQRKRAHLTPDEVRARLQQRLEEASVAPLPEVVPQTGPALTERPGCRPRLLRRRGKPSSGVAEEAADR